MPFIRPIPNKLVLFDGVCNLCNFTVNFIIDRDQKKEYYFAPLQSETAKSILLKYGMSQNEMNSVILIKGNQIYQKSDAVLEIIKDFSLPYQIFQIGRILPKYIRDYLYDCIAKNRYRFFGKTETCKIPTPELRERFLE